MASLRPTTWISFFKEAGIPPATAERYSLTFFDNRITFDLLPELNKEYLKDMGIRVLGDVIAILKHARNVQEQNERKRNISCIELSPQSEISTTSKDTVSDASNHKSPTFTPRDPSTKISKPPDSAPSHAKRKVGVVEVGNSSEDRDGEPLPKKRSVQRVTLLKGCLTKRKEMKPKNIVPECETVPLTTKTINFCTTQEPSCKRKVPNIYYNKHSTTDRLETKTKNISATSSAHEPGEHRKLMQTSSIQGLKNKYIPSVEDVQVLRNTVIGSSTQGRMVKRNKSLPATDDFSSQPTKKQPLFRTSLHGQVIKKTVNSTNTGVTQDTPPIINRMKIGASTTKGRNEKRKMMHTNPSSTVSTSQQPLKKVTFANVPQTSTANVLQTSTANVPYTSAANVPQTSTPKQKRVPIRLNDVVSGPSEVKKVRRVLPEHEGRYKILLPKGTTPRSQQILAKQGLLQGHSKKKNVFDRLGNECSISSTVESEGPRITITGLSTTIFRNNKDKQYSVFSRLGEKPQVSSSTTSEVTGNTLEDSSSREMDDFPLEDDSMLQGDESTLQDDDSIVHDDYSVLQDDHLFLQDVDDYALEEEFSQDVDSFIRGRSVPPRTTPYVSILKKSKGKKVIQKKAATSTMRADVEGMEPIKQQLQARLGLGMTTVRKGVSTSTPHRTAGILANPANARVQSVKKRLGGSSSGLAGLSISVSHPELQDMVMNSTGVVSVGSQSDLEDVYEDEDAYDDEEDDEYDYENEAYHYEYIDDDEEEGSEMGSGVFSRLG